MSLLEHALAGAPAEQHDDPVADRILDAALALAAASGLRNLTMDDVARRAGVGRMTVYRRFGDRRRLVEALSAREGRRCLDELDRAADPAAPFADQIAATFATAVRLTREHPLLARLARTEPEAVVSALTADDAQLFGLARGFAAARLATAREAGLVHPGVDVAQAAELLVRMALSFALIEDSVLPVADDAALRAVGRRLLAPVLTGPTAPGRA